MSKGFYIKLAWNNIKKNSKAYIPYILASIGTIIMFYNMCYLAFSKDMGHINDNQSLKEMLSFGAIITGIFSFLFLSYTNSFLTKQRKMEFGLFNILGMEKRHIAWIMCLETLIVSLISLVTGILGGMVLSKLIELLLFKLINYKLVFGFDIPVFAIIITVVSFAGIFAINLIYNILQVYLSRPIELLKGGNAGEREPKTKYLSTIIGVVSLGIGYYIALTIQTPLSALSMFFVAVLFVMLGTHNLFKAGSIALLKSLRKNKTYYYKTNHFISVSGMIYRMKQNAAGLANICILSTAVIITLSTTLSLYLGVEDVLLTRYPRNIIIKASNISEENAEKIEEIINTHTSRSNIIKENIYRYREMSFITSQKEEKFILANNENYSSKDLAQLVLVTADHYNEIEDKEVSLDEGEALVFVINGEIPGDKIVLNDYELHIKERLKSFYNEGNGETVLSNSYFIVVDSIETIREIYTSLEGEKEAKDDTVELSYLYGFDMDEYREAQIGFAQTLKNDLDKLELGIRVDSVERERSGFYTVYGGLFFLGLFIGLLFIMATVLIIYYKQIAEGYDDKARFEILKKVGMSHREIKKSIGSQVLMVFFLPLVTAVIHIAFAFKLMTKMLFIFNLTNISLYVLCTVITIIIFAIFYLIVYGLTARTYYKIVR